jgi:ATP-dependent Clp protease ATP-binding subunit ClpC
VLAKALFGSFDALIRLDMSEYMEKHSISRLIGAPPGYVGYGEGGLLIEKVRRRPYSIILFDEIEKAHPDVLHLLLQVLEDGMITDPQGRTANFSSSIIIMTSNLITSNEGRPRSLGFTEDAQCEKNTIRNHPKLYRFFKPEFLGRIDEIILFSSLCEAELRQISEIMLTELQKRSATAGIELCFDSSVSEHLAQKCYRLHKGLGARPLRHEIRESIESPLSDIIIKQEKSKGTKILVLAKNEAISFQLKN